MPQHATTPQILFVTTDPQRGDSLGATGNPFAGSPASARLRFGPSDGVETVEQGLHQVRDVVLAGAVVRARALSSTRPSLAGPRRDPAIGPSRGVDRRRLFHQAL